MDTLAWKERYGRFGGIDWSGYRNAPIRMTTQLTILAHVRTARYAAAEIPI